VGGITPKNLGSPRKASLTAKLALRRLKIGRYMAKGGHKMKNELNCFGEIIVVDEFPTEEEIKSERGRFCIQETFLSKDGKELKARWIGATTQPMPLEDLVAVVTHRNEYISGQKYISTGEIYVTPETIKRLRNVAFGSNIFTSVAPNCGAVAI